MRKIYPVAHDRPHSALWAPRILLYASSAVCELFTGLKGKNRAEYRTLSLLNSSVLLRIFGSFTQLLQPNLSML